MMAWVTGTTWPRSWNESSALAHSQAGLWNVAWRGIAVPALEAHPLGRYRADVLAATPVVDSDVLDVCHPSAVVVAETPGVLEPRPPAPVSFDLDGPWGSEAPFGKQVDELSHAVLQVDPAGDRLGGASSSATRSSFQRCRAGAAPTARGR